MSDYIDKSHDRRGELTEYRNRVDLDTAFKERGMNGFYPTRASLEQKELHAFYVKKVKEKGVKKVTENIEKGKMYSEKDLRKM